MKKKFRFKKGISKTHIPIMLNDVQSWEEQIKEAEDRFLKKYELGKSHYLGFEITDMGAELYVRKKIKELDS